MLTFFPSYSGYESAGLNFPALRACKNIQFIRLKIPIFCLTCYPNLGIIPRTVWDDALSVLLLPPSNSLRRIEITLEYIKAPMSALMACCLHAIDNLDRGRVDRSLEHHIESLESVDVCLRAFSTTQLYHNGPSIEECKRIISKRFKQSRFGRLFSITF